MEISSYNPVLSLTTKKQHDKLKLFFISHLNLTYCAKSYLVKQLPEIEDLPNFDDLKFAIAETTEGVKKQIIRIREIFVLLDTQISIENAPG